MPIHATTTAVTLLLKAVQQVLVLAMIAGALWCVELSKPVAERVIGVSWEAFGIQPRTPHGLIGVVAAPLVHIEQKHLWHNLVPLLLLGWLVMLEGAASFWKAVFWIVVLSGSAVWLCGVHGANYLGSSAVSHGFLGYVMMRAVVLPRWQWIATGVAALFACGGMVYAWFGARADVSLLAHAAGFVSGMFAAWIAHRPSSALDGVR